MPGFEYEINFLQVGLKELKSYLLSSEIYWPVGIRPPHGTRAYPQMTLGWLLLFQLKLRGVTSTYQRTVAEIDLGLDRSRNKWMVAWQNKAMREFQTRLRLWTSFVNEFRSNPEGNLDRYTYEIQKRTMLDLLSGQAETVSEEESALLRGTDLVLRNLLPPGEFVWDEIYRAGFPQVDFWYLYRDLTVQSNANPV